jgi:hypothetical protein
MKFLWRPKVFAIERPMLGLRLGLEEADGHKGNLSELEIHF